LVVKFTLVETFSDISISFLFIRKKPLVLPNRQYRHRNGYNCVNSSGNGSNLLNSAHDSDDFRADYCGTKKFGKFVGKTRYFRS